METVASTSGEQLGITITEKLPVLSPPHTPPPHQKKKEEINRHVFSSQLTSEFSFRLRTSVMFAQQCGSITKSHLLDLGKDL